MQCFVLGSPGPVGGASTELWHTLRLWRSYGVDVVVIPTWEIAIDQLARLASIGISVLHLSSVDGLYQIPQIESSTVVSFCNGHFIDALPGLRALGCRLVWVNCMTWISDAEINTIRLYGPCDAYVFQSNFQRTILAPAYLELGVTSSAFHMVRGAFEPGEFPFVPLPHPANTTFYVGRLARSDSDKWHHHYWDIYRRVQFRPLEGRIMGWTDRLTEKCGLPPDGVIVRAAGVQSAPSFLASVHCLVSKNGFARENWPRVGLEAMSTGVIVIAENQGGWPEMITHGETGFLANDDGEMSAFIDLVATDEALRTNLIIAARARLQDELAVPNEIWEGWRRILES